MASIGEVGAQTPNKEDGNQDQNVTLDLYFGVFFDGTGNNMIPSSVAKERRKKVKKATLKKKDWDLYLNKDLVNGANSVSDKEIEPQKQLNSKIDSLEYQGSGRSNIAILHSCYQGKEEKQQQDKIYNIYIEGPGKDSINKDSKIQDVKNALGSGFGNGKTGVVALVSKAVKMIRLVLDGFGISEISKERDSNKTVRIHFDVFGFSRGAACARLFSFIAGRGEKDFLGCEEKFANFQASEYFVNDRYLHFLDKLNVTSEVSFLGIFDTVSSIGITYDNNVADFGMFSPDEAWVKETFHICAMDEFRSHFALTDINTNKKGNIEIYIPGCHSDIGGGYQIGAEKFLLNYRESLMSKYKMIIGEKAGKENGENGETENISSKCLEMLGWGYSEEIKDHEIRGYVTCKRKKVLSGYSNIPLLLMKYKAEKAGRNGMFVDFPKGRFDVPSDLSRIKDTFMKEIENLCSGRKWLFPGGSYCSNEYRELRHPYLHFSATDSILSSNSSIVHSPNIKDGIICRIIYHGSKYSLSEPTYMCNMK